MAKTYLKRKEKKLYAEMLVDSLINDEWTKVRVDYYSSTERFEYESPRKSSGKYTFKFNFRDRYLFSKRPSINIGVFEKYEKYDYNIKFGILSPVFWRIVRMQKDFRLNRTKVELARHTDIYKAYKEEAGKRSIEELERTLANLNKLEEEYLERLQSMQEEEV